MPRPIWTGSITFGLVSIPVQLQTATRDKHVQFHRLTRDGTCRLRQKLYCPDTKKEYDFQDTARGVEIGKGEYVLVDEKEIDRIKPVKGRAIEIQQFVKLEEIDPVYFDKVYFVTPEEGNAKPYGLLHEVMAEDKSIAVARFVMREKEYLAALRVMGKGIVLHTLFYGDEVLSLDEALPKTTSKPAAREVQVARQLVQAMTRPFDISVYRDEYRDQLESLVERKTKGRKAATPDEAEEDESIPPTINLMEALRKSLAARKPASTHRKSA